MLGLVWVGSCDWVLVMVPISWLCLCYDMCVLITFMSWYMNIVIMSWYMNIVIMSWYMNIVIMFTLWGRLWLCLCCDIYILWLCLCHDIYILWLWLRYDVYCDCVYVMIYLCDDKCLLWVWVDDDDHPVLSLCWVCVGLWVGWCVILVELILSLGWDGVELDCPASSGCWK